MPAAQGVYPRTYKPGQMVGEDQNGRMTNNSVEYRGRPWAWVNAFDRHWIDSEIEVNKSAKQRGLRWVGVLMRTGTISPSH